MEGRRAWSVPERAIGGGRSRFGPHTVAPVDGDGGSGAAPRPSDRPVIVGLLVLSVTVQVFVWGTTSGGGGALLPGLRPVFGVAYAAVVLAVELGYCAYHGLRDAAVAVVVTAAVVDLLFWAARLGGLHFPTGAAAALTAGFGAVALGAGVLSGRLGASVRN
jgi:hypothetical protein